MEAKDNFRKRMNEIKSVSVTYRSRVEQAYELGGPGFEIR